MCKLFDYKTACDPGQHDAAAVARRKLLVTQDNTTQQQLHAYIALVLHR